MIHVQAEVTVSGLPFSRGAQAILQNTRAWTTCSAPGATEHLTYFLMVKVHVKVCRHFSPFSYVQQWQRHEEWFNLESRLSALALEIWECRRDKLLQMLTSKCRSVKSKCFRSLHWWLVLFHSRWHSLAAWGWAIGMLSWTFSPVSPQTDAPMRCQPSARPLGSSEPAFGES